MQILLRFWRTTVLWAIALTLVLTLRDLFIQFTGDFANGIPGLKLVLMRVPETLALTLPFTGFASAIFLTSSSRWHLRWEHAGPIAALVLSAGLAVFLLFGHVGPWTKAMAMNSLLSGHEPRAPSSRGQLLAQYLEATSYARENPELISGDASEGRAVAYGLGYRYYLPVAGGWLSAILVALGLLAGNWTRPTRGRIQRIAHLWIAGLFLLLSVILANRIGMGLATQHFVTPSLASCTILVIPAIVTLTLGWATWTARENPDPELFAGDSGQP